MKTRNFTAAILLTLVLSVALGYAVFWYGIAGQIDDGIKNLYAQAAHSGITVEGNPPAISGFPGKHVLHFSGTLHQDDFALHIPMLEISGFPLPGQIIGFTLPQGISVSGPSVDQSLLSLSYLGFSGPVPSSFPEATTVESLRRWRDGGGLIDIKSFEAHKESLQVSGYGQLKLDSDLQITGYSNVTVRGHIAFMGFLENKKLIDPQQKLVTTSVLGSLSSKDPESGERFLKASLAIQNRKLLLGPIKILTIPAIEWPYEGMPTLDLE